MLLALTIRKYRLSGVRFSLCAGSLAVLWVGGCASPGVPRPPSLHLPEIAADLQAERVGGEVRLTWKTPATTTDGEAVRGGLSAVLCRRQGTGACVPLRQFGVVPGISTAIDALPGTLRVGADSLLEYRVELRNDRGRSAGASEGVFAAGGRAPETPAPVLAVARREGVLVTWEPAAGGAAGVVVQLRRTGGVAVKPGPPARPVAPAKKRVTAPFGGGEKPADGAVVLVAEGSGDQHGMLDRSARAGETYTYVAERLRHTQAGGRTLELRSAAAPPVTIVYRDLFPPQAPVGLATVPGGGFGAAPSIDLSWEPNGESDLLGYKVYRSVDGGAQVLLTAQPVVAAAYRDLRVAPGHQYVYRVLAVDTHGNQSALSVEAREDLR